MEKPWVNSVWTLQQGLILPFWGNVLCAARLTLAENIADTPRLTPEVLSKHIVTNVDWLTRHTVAGFDSTQFGFLTDEERRRLIAGVEGVGTVASELIGTQQATQEQRERALPHFQEVLEVLEFDRYGDVPALVLGKQVERRLATDWPQHLDHLRFDTGLDSTNDPALWVWVFVAESGEFDDQRFVARAGIIEDALEPIARGVAPEGRVYLTFRSTLDLPEAQGVLA